MTLKISQSVRASHTGGIEGRGVHAEVDIDHKVVLAAGSWLAVKNDPDCVLGSLLGNGILVGTQIVPQEELVTLGAGSDRITAPDEPDARLVLRSVRILDRKAELATL